MSYDIRDDPPRSVEVERQIISVLDRIDEIVKAWHLVLGLILLVVLDAATRESGEPASSESAVVEWISQIALVDVGVVGGIVLGSLAVGIIIISLHEICHVLAFRAVGIRSDWELTWTTIRGREVKPLIAGGVCKPRSTMLSLRMSYLENLFVSLSPLVLSALILVGIGLLDVGLGVGPGVTSGVVFVTVLVSGPSLPDWGAILSTPVVRWDRLQTLDEAIEPHRVAEGI